MNAATPVRLDNAFDNAEPRQVLVVEDSEPERLRLSLMLKHVGHTVISCSSADEALPLLELNSIDVIVCDWEMPRMSGPELCGVLIDKLGNDRPHFILLTGRDRTDDLVAGMDAGADDFITKPARSGELRVRVQAGIRKLLQKENAELKQRMDTMLAAQNELHKAYVQVQRSESDKDELVKVLSHDLREPLRAIQSLSSLLPKLRASGDFEALEQSVQFIQVSVKRMAALQERMRRYFSLGSHTETSQIDITALIAQEIHELKGQGRSFSAEVASSDTATFVGRRGDVKVLISNLLDNSLKFQSEETPCKIRIAVRSIDEGIEITIEDNGIGVEAKNCSKIFEMFSRLHRRDEYPGYGTGLAECKKIAQDHGGKIEAQQTGGGGLRVQVVLAGIQIDNASVVAILPRP